MRSLKCSVITFFVTEERQLPAADRYDLCSVNEVTQNCCDSEKKIGSTPVLPVDLMSH